MPAAAQGVGFSGPQGVSPPLPGPVYQAGELSRYEGSTENGAYQRETEEQGFMPPPPMMASAGQDFTSQPRPYPGHRGFYPYYDYMFLTGQYPPGTVSHASSSYEHGHDSWQDSHYVRDYAPYNPGPSQTETFTDSAAPQSFQAPEQPVAGYSKGDAHPPAYRNAMQPGLRHQVGGYNVGKVC